mgnify:CR=1 FL=1
MRLGSTRAENENCVSVFGGALAFHYLCFSGLVRFSDSGRGRGFPFRVPGRTKKQIDKTMDSVRLKKIESLLTEELSDILRRWAKENKPGILVSVTRVAVTSDLSLARVRVSLFPVKDKAGFLAELREQMPHFRGELGNRIRHQVRKIPELEFFDDDSLDYIEAIDRELRGEGENPIRK